MKEGSEGKESPGRSNMPIASNIGYHNGVQSDSQGRRPDWGVTNIETRYHTGSISLGGKYRRNVSLST